MDLVFVLSTGGTFSIRGDINDTFLDVKRKIRDTCGISVSSQTLIFEGSILHDNRNVSTYNNISDGSCIRVKVRIPTSTITLRVKTPNSERRFPIQMGSDDRISVLKDEIALFDGIPKNQIIVRARGIELEDHRSIRDCGLRNNSEVDIILRPQP